MIPTLGPLKDGNPSSEYLAHEIRDIVKEEITLSK
jgi:hypothetical protein